MNFWLGKMKYQNTEVYHVVVSMTADKVLRLADFKKD